MLPCRYLSTKNSSEYCSPVLPIDKPDTVFPSALPHVSTLVVEFSLTSPPQERILIGNGQFVMETVDNIILMRRIVQVDNLPYFALYIIGKIIRGIIVH